MLAEEDGEPFAELKVDMNALMSEFGFGGNDDGDNPEAEGSLETELGMNDSLDDAVAKDTAASNAMVKGAD